VRRTFSALHGLRAETSWLPFKANKLYYRPDSHPFLAGGAERLLASSFSKVTISY
tara:strand:- start:597 stop:761 length:165 start_codon:yes stop_codon:yes gene_type:complete